MFNKLKQAIFCYTPASLLVYDIGFLLLRFFVGLALCTIFEKLLPQNGIWGPQDWFVHDVADMGFPFPEVFAWLAVLIEFFGGILLMIGFFTRPAAILNVIVTFVAAFLYHKGAIAQAGLTAFFFMIMCICISFFGAGKFSLDYFFSAKLKKTSRHIVLLIPFLALGGFLEAQTISPSDLQKMNGNWDGQLRYTDYKDDVSQTELKCGLEVKWKKKKGTFLFTFTEPNGQVFTDKTKVKLIKRGTYLKFDGNYKLVAFDEKGDPSSWEAILIKRGKDNRKNAELKLLIRCSPQEFLISKFVRYDGTNDFFIRNSYTFERQKE